jgi:hypothetical protein
MKIKEFCSFNDTIKKMKRQFSLVENMCWAWCMVVYICNPNYLEGGEQEDHSSKPACQKVSKPLSQK